MRAGMNPRKMEKMMKQMGMKQKNINAKRLIIETDEGNLVFEKPSVTEINVQGQSTFQVVGSYTKEVPVVEVEIPEGDIELVCQQTGADKEKALAALKDTNGDIAEAIIKLQS